MGHESAREENLKMRCASAPGDVCRRISRRDMALHSVRLAAVLRGSVSSARMAAETAVRRRPEVVSLRFPLTRLSPTTKVLNAEM